VSGPAILQASSFWRNGEPVVIDLLPDFDIHAALLEKRHSKLELHNFLSAYFPKRFAGTWCELVAGSRPLARYGDRELARIGDLLHRWEFLPHGTEGYAVAEATAGGVDTRGLSSKTMEARSVSGLYFIGEVVDVTGMLGGYNLHWAWASGNAAGLAA
jgi:hypothetical protein